MSEPRILNQDQIAAYRRDGFVHVPGFYGASQVARIAWWCDELVKRPEAPGRHMIYYEDSPRRARRRILQRVENFLPYHAEFRALLTEGRLIAAMGELLGSSAVLFKEKINLKQPGGAGFSPHQDMQAGWRCYANRFVTALVGIDPATPANGCLELAPGRHGAGLLGEEGGSLDPAVLADMAFVACPTRPGDAIFFDCYAPHRSSPNLTEYQRRVLYVTYNRAEEGDHRVRYFDEKRRAYPPDIERPSGKARLGEA